ncbi:MAG TPA: dephospho-CoA kinase [Deltaproteobacteria bacterium]|nr:MAG: dephospho-CoA kinase [Deltaproteobacteria bacterium GWA2_42_85]OGP29639.1 MAG: dephospho-CoA kinase [Deltaproteobacteria bacterium GWB2_42_7]OGP38124.1 MAG: dephospho-CoA kinase [Deltaproteobacteria bacterium GWD2_42_10]OGP48256.1 MAG: dephospho-CoA kinase [Deltaproteobacteria bacterium GWF2_42_12]OGQ25084.1 MAG: dephospho-CoA kinase [Deltaproteobacteria bacterium RIFCSPHIGHO2_02_FULL_42_44]OGQ38252.1 MAG: dephospho-CoA kinase [Deltaproteobacteria bacterium RIFCSPLOWO2_02_FULL_42_39]O
MMLIGLTGGIASGKSLVAGELKRLGAYLIDADEIAREVVKRGLPAYSEIVKEFGEKILNPDKTINRKELGRIVFSNPELRKRLEQITHPRIRKKIEAEISAIKAKNPKAVIVVDAALLIEGGLYKKMDKVIVVCADEKTQIKRLTERDGLAIEDAKNRIASQMPLKEKRRYADFVIENVEGKSREEVKEEVKRVFDRLKDKR